MHGSDDDTQHDQVTSEAAAATRVPSILAIEALHTLDRKGLIGTALTFATGVPTLLVVAAMLCAVVGGVSIATPWLLGGVLAASVLGAIGTRNLRQSSARRAALLALQHSNATASLSGDTLEIHAVDRAQPWRFALGGRSRSLRMLPAARVVGMKD